jgi:hypothetical protein
LSSVFQPSFVNSIVGALIGSFIKLAKVWVHSFIVIPQLRWEDSKHLKKQARSIALRA